jgi:hypothetical protein
VIGEFAMRNKVKTVLLFIVGLLIGAFASFVIFGKMNQRLYARSYALSVIEQAFLATELRAHRQEELQKRIEANLPSAVLAIHQHKELQSVPESQSALRSVKDFYEMNAVPVPKEIESILNDLSSKH